MSKPFDSKKYRRQNQKYGVVPRWEKAFPCECVDPMTGTSAGDCELCERDGRRYELQTLPPGIDGQPLRVLVYQSKQEIVTTEFGPLGAGSTMVSVFPDLMPVARFDRIALPDRFNPHREIITRGESDRDELMYAPMLDTVSVSRNGLPIASGWSISGREIIWTANPPIEGSRYTVEYQALQVYWFAQRTHAHGTGSDGLPLMDEWLLSLKPAEHSDGN